MSNLGPAGEFLRICEHYRSLSDGELIALAQKPAELTDIARQALADEVSQRRLSVPPLEEPAARPNVVPPPEVFDPTDPEHDSPYEADRQLVQICTVWSVRDAFRHRICSTRRVSPFLWAPNERPASMPSPQNSRKV